MQEADCAIWCSITIEPGARVECGNTTWLVTDASRETLMEIFVFARLHARPGKQREVQQAMFEVQGPTRLEPGCLSYGGFRAVRDPDEFYIHTRWRNMEAFERHAELPHTVRFVETVEPLVDHPFKVTLAEQLW